MRLQRLLNCPGDVVLVAEAGHGTGLAGWIQGSLCQYLESDYRVEIAGLVVDDRFHRRGIGRDLVAASRGLGSRTWSNPELGALPDDPA